MNDQDLASRDVPLDAVLHTGCGTLHAYWDGLRGGRFAPAWGAFQLIDLPAAIIPYMRVADVIDGGADFRYRFWGTGLSFVRALDRTGKRLSAIDSPRTPAALEEYRRIVREKRGFASVYDARTHLPGAGLHAPCIRLPLSSDGETVDKIACYTDFETDSADWRQYFDISKR